MKKNHTVAYTLWLALGLVGAHRIYLGRVGTGLAMATITILGVVPVLAVALNWRYFNDDGTINVALRFAEAYLYRYIGIGFIFLAISWWLADAFGLSKMVRASNKSKL